ncbi:late embryogenesis abundant protein, LEA-14 [Tanacetum coccineum]
MKLTIQRLLPTGDHSSRSSKRGRCICLSLALTILAIGLIILILALTVFKSKKPVTTVNSVVLNDVNATVNLIPLRVSLNVSLDVTITVRNPNKVGFSYQNSSAALLYKGHDIGNVPIPAGKIGSDDSKQMNLTLTIFADRLLTDIDVYGDVISGNFPVSTYTKIKGKVRILNLFNIHVVSTSTCDLKIDVLNQKIAKQSCHYKNKGALGSNKRIGKGKANDMTKRSPIKIVKNVLVKIQKFLFPSDFMVLDMLNTRNETMILERPFLATIHAKTDIFNKEISLGIGDTSSRVEETNDVHNKNNSCNQKQGQSRKKPRKLEFDINLPNTQFCKPIKQILEGELKFWPICDPNIKECNGGHKVYEMNKEGDLKKWYCYYDDDRKRINGADLSFLEFLLVKYGENQEKGLIWDERFEEWCNKNPNAPTSKFTLIYENLNPRPKDYPFKDWLLTKVGHTNISEPVKKTLLKTWLIDCFQEDVAKDPQERSFDDYMWMFDIEIDQLADEYELGIGKKGHMLEEEEERRKLRINIVEYEPPMVHVETFKVKIYSFDTGQSFIYVTKELMDALPMGRENGSRFRDMIRKEVDSGRRIHRQT